MTWGTQPGVLETLHVQIFTQPVHCWDYRGLDNAGACRGWIDFCRWRGVCFSKDFSFGNIHRGVNPRTHWPYSLFQTFALRHRAAFETSSSTHSGALAQLCLDDDVCHIASWLQSGGCKRGEPAGCSWPFTHSKRMLPASNCGQMASTLLCFPAVFLLWQGFGTSPFTWATRYNVGYEAVNIREDHEIEAGKNVGFALVLFDNTFVEQVAIVWK